MYDHTLELTREVEAEVREFFGEIVYWTVIPRDVTVSEAPSHGQSFWTMLREAAAPWLTRSFAWRCWNVSKERRLGRGLEALLGRSYAENARPELTLHVPDAVGDDAPATGRAATLRRMPSRC